ncbi:MAG: peptidylprolyl isomerase SurA [Gammaproteobacteria bacterium]|nr:peptidylprolyl isomerase SurA [Gammaproteobacteria bacterium]
MKTIFRFLLVAMLVLQVMPAVSKPKLLDRVVAIVDGDVVLGSELVRRVNSIIKSLNERKQKAPPIETLKQQVLDRLILESIQLQMADRIGVKISDAELDATLLKISEDNKMTLAQFRQSIIKDGTPWQTFREDIRRDIKINRTRGAFVSRRIQISEKEVDNLLAQINEQGASRMQYLIQHILLPVGENELPEEVEKTRNKAAKMVKELRDGANFDEYAVSYSAGANALSGGSLGWRSLSQLPSLFADQVKNMNAGDISEPLRSGSGLHILYLKETKGGFQGKSVIQTHARHILISPNEILDDKAALDKINLIRQRILDGEDFKTLAIEFSDDKGSGSLGGDLNWADPGTFVPEFTQTMDKLAVNELSRPVKSDFGWHIIEVLGRRSKDQTEDMKRERAYRIIQNRKFEEEAEIWLREIREEAYVSILIEDE